MNEALNITCNMFCFSHLSGVKPGYREQVVASLPGTMAPATQCVSSLFPPAVCGRTAQNRSVQPQSAAPRWRTHIQFSTKSNAKILFVITNVLHLAFYRRTSPALNKSGEEQSDHRYLGGAPNAHVPLTTLHPPTAEESLGKSGAANHAGPEIFYVLEPSIHDC